MGIRHMGVQGLSERTSITLDEIRNRVAYALHRHPLCRQIEFDIVSTPRSRTGGNWTVSLHAIAPAALWEASDIVADIQEAYDLAEDRVAAPVELV